MEKLPVFINRDDAREPMIGSLGRASDEAEALALIIARCAAEGIDPPPAAQADDIEIRTVRSPFAVKEAKRLAAARRGTHEHDFFASKTANGLTLELRAYVGA